MFDSPIAVIAGAIFAGIIFGVVKGIFYVIKQSEKREPPGFEPLGTGSSWNELSGEYRPIIAKECRETHRELAADIKSIVTKLSVIEKALIENKAEIHHTISESVLQYIDRHERGYHRSK